MEEIIEESSEKRLKRQKKMSNRFYEPTKADLLKKYAEDRMSVHEFIQFDGWKDCKPDAVFRPDKDNDWICSGRTHEIRASPPDLAVRVFVHVGTTREETVRLLEKILRWVRNDGDGWNFETGDEAMETSSKGSEKL